MLKPLIIVAMDQYPLGLSEFDLLLEIKKTSDVFPKHYHGDNLELFHTHFLLFNSLYRLRSELITEGRQTIEIGPFNIQLRAFSADKDTQALADALDIKLEEYYVDMRNLENTGMEDVNGMLDDFWRKYLAQNHKLEALQELGLDKNAGWPEVQKRYRELAAKYHPDKGGNKESFQRITDAKETLAICLSNFKRA